MATSGARKRSLSEVTWDSDTESTVLSQSRNKQL